jgi:hypothetical protein
MEMSDEEMKDPMEELVSMYAADYTDDEEDMDAALGEGNEAPQTDTEQETTEVDKGVPAATTAAQDEGFVFNRKKYETSGWTGEQIAEVERLEKAAFHKEKMIQRQALEVGGTRKKLSELSLREAQLNDQLNKLNEKEENDYSVAGTEDHIIARHRIKEEQERLRREQTVFYKEHQIAAAIPDIKELLETELRDMLVADSKIHNLQPHEIDNLTRQVVSGGYMEEPIETLVQLAGRLREQKRNREMRDRIKKLESERDLLLKAPDKYGKSLAAAARQGTTTVRKGSNPAPDVAGPADIRKQLKQIYNGG